MNRRFPGGVAGLLEALMWIQREAATGALGPAGGTQGRLVFRDGILMHVDAAAGSAPVAGAELREQAGGIMEDWSFGEALLLFQGGDDAGQPSTGAGKLTSGDLILDLVRHNADARWVARRLSEASGKIANPATLPKVLPRVSMTPTEAFLLSRADGTMTLDEILQVSPLDPTDVKLGLYALLAAGLLTAPGVTLPGAGAGSEEMAEETSLPPSVAAPPHPAPEASASSSRPAAPLVPNETATPPAAGAIRTEREPRTATKAVSPAAPPPPAPPAEVPAAAADPIPAQTASTASRSVLDQEAFLARTDVATKPVTPDSPASPPPAHGGGAAAAAAAVEREGARPPGKPGARAGAVSELEQERAEVLGWISSRTGHDYYGILGVERSAGEEAVRRAYYRVAKRFHPDRFRRPGFEGLLQDVERMFAATTEAYNTLSDDRARVEYEREVSARAKHGKGPEGDMAARARESYLRARKHADAEEYFDAAALLETACRFDGSRPEYWLLLGTVQAKNPRWRKKAEESYQKVIEMNPASPDGHLHLARLYQAGGLTKRARDMYRKVIQWDPQNEEAQAALSGKDMGQDAGVAGKLRSIFKGSRS